MPKIALTDRFCSGAKARGERTDYFDENTPGLALRVSEGGHRSWTFHFTSPRDGKRARHHLGTYPATTLARARGLAIAARQQVEDGSDPRNASAGAAEMTFAGLARLYFEDPAKAQLRTIAEIKRRIEKDATPVIGDVKIAKLVRGDVKNVLKRVAGRDAPQQAAHVFSDIRAILRWAVREEYLGANPIDGMAKPPGSAPKERALSDEEIKTLWNVLPTALPKSETCRRIIKLLLITGQRLGEVAGMSRSELRLRENLWELPGSRVKNGFAHTVPLSTLALEIIGEVLAEIPDEQQFLFAGEDGNRLNPHVVTRTITRSRTLFGIKHWSAHDLRRTALTGMAKIGVEPHVIAHVANHRSITKGDVTFAHYVQYTYDAEKHVALSAWAERLSAIVAGSGEIVPMRRAAT